LVLVPPLQIVLMIANGQWLLPETI
jgi:hypothetical protein